MAFGIELKRNFYPEKIAKQMQFATAKAFTSTAKQAQGGVIANLQSEFTIRGNWLGQSGKLGIKVKPVTKNKLEAEVYTLADWLAIHETGGTKLPRGKMLAIPTANVRRNKRQIIQRSNRPQAIRGKEDVFIQTKNGLVLFQRKGRGKNKKLVDLYGLETSAQIKEKSPFIVPAMRVINNRLMKNWQAAFVEALKTAK